MTVYKNGKNGKWYGQGSVNNERYHRLLEGAKSKSEALEMDSAIRYQISLRQKGLLRPEESEESEEPRRTIEDGIAIWKTHAKLYNVDYKHDLEKIGTLTEFFKRNNIDYLDQITTSVAEKFQTYLLEEKQNNRTHTKGLKPATVNRKVAVLKKICSLAVRNRYLKENPLVRFRTLEENNMRKRYLSKEEETSLFKHLPEHTKAIVFIDLRTGLRLSKVLQLKWSNINFDKKQLTLIKRKKGKPVPEILELSNDTIKLLQTLQTLPNKSEYVFINPRTGKPYTRIDKSFKNACIKANITDFKFHDLRHTVATRMIESGVDIRTVQEQLGHSSVRTTERYTHSTREAKRKAMDILDTYNEEE